MSSEPNFASIGTKTDDIDVRLSYRIVELFSEGLYGSPNKAVEELVANSFDAGAGQVHVVLSTNLHDQGATIAVIDDGEGMDPQGLRRHWLIGISNKRELAALPRARKQIGKFGIGKLATYVLANRLTHVSRRAGKYYSTSMDYRAIEKRVDRAVEPKAPVKIALRELTKAEARTAVKPWVNAATRGALFFGMSGSRSWTVSIMSSLKDKVHEIKPGLLRWVLRSAMPLRPDFGVWLNGERLKPTKEDKSPIQSWTLGKDLVELPKPSPKGVTRSEDLSVDLSDEYRFGLDVPGLGRITGYVEVYKDLLTGGKSDQIGRSHGFFVYLYGRLLNVADGHFGISPNELRHGTFGRFRLVVHMDGLDGGLRSNREAIGEGPLLETAQSVLRAIFNFVRPVLEAHDSGEEPGATLARKLASSPMSLSRGPIVDLSRAVAEGKATSRNLVVPRLETEGTRQEFLETLDRRAREAENFITGVTVDLEGSSQDGVVKYDTTSGVLRLNGWHPFVATFHDEFTNKKLGQPLELLAMAEVLVEAHLYVLGAKQAVIDEFLSVRDELLRHLADESGRQSALSAANALSDARNSPDGLERAVCNAFRSLGFDVTPFGKSGQPDGVASAHLPADNRGRPRHYRVSLEAKSTKWKGSRVSAKDVSIAAVIRHRDQHGCGHAVVVGPAFQTSKGEDAALAEDIARDRRNTEATGNPKTITLVTVDDLARLVRLRPVKRVGLQKLRELFTACSLDEQSGEWVDAVATASVTKPPYAEIVRTIEGLQREYKREAVRYSALRVKLTTLSPAIRYETDGELLELCRAMSQMAPEAMFASEERVELDQSAENVIGLIETAMQEYPRYE